MAAYGSASAPMYGFQAAKNTTTYGGPSQPLTTAAPRATAVSPYGGQAAKNTSPASDGLYPATPPLSQPTKTVAPAPAAAAPAPAAQAPAAAATPAAYDYTTDPVLQQVQASAAAATSEAQAQAAAAQNQLAIQYSDPGMALDPTYAATAAANPYGVLALLASQEPLDQHALDESENKSNLFYSGDRIHQQDQLAQQYGQKRADAATAEQQASQQIQATLLAAEQAQRQQVLGANNDAYNRFLQQLLASQTATAPVTAGSGDTSSSAGGSAGTDGSGDVTPSTLAAYLASPVGRANVQAVQAHPASAGASGAAGVLTGQTKKNYQAAARAA